MNYKSVETFLRALIVAIGYQMVTYLLMSRFLRSEDRCTMMVFKSQDIELVVYKVSNEENVALNP